MTIGLYIHVPYCRVACPYCDFVKKPIEGDAPDAFAQAVCNEIQSCDGPANASSIFFGGGTPSLLEARALNRILDTLRERFTIADNAEVSMEVNPDDIAEDALSIWQDSGVTRLSLGVQSFDDRALSYLGRCHDAACARRACEAIGTRFENWGIDLIFGGPPTDAWQSSLAECVSLAPPHVSTYGLTFEESTPFWKRRAEALDSDASLTLYRAARETLSDYEHYEVSNFARPGFECIHNRIYWRNDEYLGFGPGAYSYFDGVRSRNAPRINHYVTHPDEKSEKLVLSDREIRVETLIQHFRTRSGLARAAYADRFSTTLDADFADTIPPLVARGLLEDDGQVLRPTRLGYELNDEIGLALVS